MSRIDLFAPEIGYQSGKAVLRDVALTAAGSEVVAVLGGNGAGKTALLRWMVGLLPRRGGHCTVDGIRIRSAKEAVAQAVGLVVQDPSDQLLGATIREDVYIGPRNLGLPPDEQRRRVDAAIATVGLGSVADRDIESLSLGERKRASLAGVLAMSPRVLLLDEPTAGLDPEAETALCETLRGLAATGMTLIVATHAIDLVPRFATRVMVLGHGRVLATGACRDVLVRQELLVGARLRRPWPTELWARVFQERVGQPLLTMEEVLQCLATASS